MQVGKSAYYDWSQRPAKVISAETLHLYRQAKALFIGSRESLGSRELVKKLRKEGIVIGRYRMRTVMRKLKLKVKQRIA
jgi:putative transposase